MDTTLEELLPDQIKSIGVTGTREMLSIEQQHAFFDVMITCIRRGVREAHHGACTGLDAFVHFHLISQTGVFTHVHPPVNKDHSAENELMRHSRRIDHEAKAYAERNQDIVDASDVLLAAPRYPEKDKRSQRSGTWQTVRKAHAADKIVLVTDNDGKVYQYVPDNAS